MPAVFNLFPNLINKFKIRPLQGSPCSSPDAARTQPGLTCWQAAAPAQLILQHGQQSPALGLSQGQVFFLYFPCSVMRNHFSPGPEAMLGLLTPPGPPAQAPPALSLALLGLWVWTLPVAWCSGTGQRWDTQAFFIPVYGRTRPAFVRDSPSSAYPCLPL